MNLKNIKNVKQCPYCKSDFGFYQKSFMSGWIQDNTLFNGEKYNTEMWDSLREKKYNPTCYCIDCNKSIGTRPLSDFF